METKFEYQVSLELTEKIALEQLELILRSRGFVLKYPQLWIGILIAIIMGAASFSSLRINGINYDLVVNAAIGFAIGFVVGLLVRRGLRSGFLAKARDAHKKMGPHRGVSWDSEGVTIDSSAFETKMGWWTIEKIQIEKVGVYGYCLGRIFFVIPKAAFPADATAENFVHTWQTQIKQPPPIKRISKP